MTAVATEKKENFERIFRQFRMWCKREGILREYREKQYYIKPSQKRRKSIRKKKY